MTDVRLAVTAFDAISPPAALELVRPLCSSPAWMDAMVARRPYDTLEAVLETSATVLAVLSGPQLQLALDTTDILVPAQGDEVAAEVEVRSALIAHVADQVRSTLA